MTDPSSNVRKLVEKADANADKNTSYGFQQDSTFLIITVSIAGILIFYFVTVTTFLTRPADSGAFGDTFGGLNTIFSGLAFVALVNALFMQSKELSLQREELQETQKLMAEQKAEMVRQAETMHLQQFESTFFQLLNQQRKILE